MCSYACTIEKAFYKHLKVHSSGTSPLPPVGSKLSCVICGKDRPSEADMNKHMRKHRDDRYFCCDICVFRTVQLKKVCVVVKCIPLQPFSHLTINYTNNYRTESNCLKFTRLKRRDRVEVGRHGLRGMHCTVILTFEWLYI